MHPADSIPDDCEDDALADALADRWLAEITAPGADVDQARKIHRALHRIESRVPVSVRMDSVISLANALGVQLPPDVLADLCGCTRAAIYGRANAALETFRTRATEAGLSDLYTALNP